jgi:hypothetical protein
MQIKYLNRYKRLTHLLASGVVCSCIANHSTANSLSDCFKGRFLKLIEQDARKKTTEKSAINPATGNSNRSLVRSGSSRIERGRQTNRKVVIPPLKIGKDSDFDFLVGSPPVTVDESGKTLAPFQFIDDWEVVHSEMRARQELSGSAHVGEIATKDAQPRLDAPTVLTSHSIKAEKALPFDKRATQEMATETALSNYKRVHPQTEIVPRSKFGFYLFRAITGKGKMMNGEWVFEGVSDSSLELEGILSSNMSFAQYRSSPGAIGAHLRVPGLPVFFNESEALYWIRGKTYLNPPAVIRVWVDLESAAGDHRQVVIFRNHWDGKTIEQTKETLQQHISGDLVIEGEAFVIHANDTSKLRQFFQPTEEVMRPSDQEYILIHGSK